MLTGGEGKREPPGPQILPPSHLIMSSPAHARATISMSPQIITHDINASLHLILPLGNRLDITSFPAQALELTRRLEAYITNAGIDVSALVRDNRRLMSHVDTITTNAS